jgi:hypothetical protein
MPEIQVTSAVEEAVPTTTTTTKKSTKTQASGNLIMDIAHEIETMPKDKALTEASKLAENVEVTYFRLGGVLQLILENSWFEGFASFDEFVFERFGFQGRKARYLISIYSNLVTKNIPWSKVSHLGWTKLKTIAPKLTLENLDEWVAKAEKLTVLELEALLKEPEAAPDKTANASDGITKLVFKFKPDQYDVASQAIAKAKGELKTEYDSVAAEGIFSAYLGNLVQIQTAPAAAGDLNEVVRTHGIQAVCDAIDKEFPGYNITIEEIGEAKPEEAQEAQPVAVA